MLEAMMRISFLLLAAADATRNNGVQTVLKMLNEMIEKGETGIAEEKQLYSEIQDTVNGRITDAEIAMKRQSELIEKFEARKSAATARAEELDSIIAEKESEHQAIQADLEKAISIRAEEKKAFQASEADLSKAVDQIGRAIGVLKSGSVNISGSFMQELASSSAPIAALLQQPQAAQTAYESKSTDVIALCKEFEKKLKTDLSDLRTGEANAANAHAVAKSAMENDIQVNERAIADMTLEAGQQRQTAGESAKAENEARTAHADAKTLLSDTKAYWAEQSKMFEANAKYRAEEVAALKEAAKIIDGESTLKLLQMPSGLTSFVQLSTASRNDNLSKQSLLSKINTQLLEANSRIYDSQKSSALALLSAQIMTGSPFDKIIKMLEKLVAKLEADATAEEAHHKWCKEEMKTTITSKTDTQKEFDALKQTESNLAAEKEQAANAEAEARSDAKTLQEDMAKAEKERAAEKAENEKTIADSVAAQTAVSSALDVLKKFYGAQEESLLQQDPTISAYKGQGDSASGVVGLMETILADFAKLEGETRGAEKTAATEHRRTVKVMKKTTVTKLEVASEKKIVQIEKAGALNSLKKKIDKKAIQLQQVSEYWNQLQPMCVPKKLSYEERVEKREAEIAALKEAYAVLDAEAK